MKNFLKNKLLVGLTAAIIIVFIIIAVLFTLIIKKNKEEKAIEEGRNQKPQTAAEEIEDEDEGTTNRIKGDFSEWVMPLEIQNILKGATTLANDDSINWGMNPDKTGKELVEQYMNPQAEEHDSDEEDDDWYGPETFSNIDGCFYNTESGDVIVYISKCIGDCSFCNPNYTYIWHIIPDENIPCGFDVTGIEKTGINRECKIADVGGSYETDTWSAFCDQSLTYPGNEIFHVQAVRDDGSVVTPSDLEAWDEFNEDKYPGDYLTDAKFLDFDNDGEIEILVGSSNYFSYGGMCFDCRPDEMHVIGEGNGTAEYLSYTWYENAFWLVYSDVTHAGRSTYELVKIGKDGKIEDNFGLYAFATGDDYEDYENYEYTYRDEQITQEEFKNLANEIFIKNNIALESEDNNTSTGAESASPDLTAVKAAYRDVVQNYYNEHKEYENEYAKMYFSMIYLDNDDIPELICGLDSYYVSMYAYKDGEAKLVIDNWPYGAFGNAGYDFYERTGLITNYNSDYAGLVTYLSIMRYDPDTCEITGEDDPGLWTSLVPDVNGDGYIDTNEAALAETESEYFVDYDNCYCYAGNRQITQEEYDSIYDAYVPTYAEALGNGVAMGADSSYEYIMSVLE